MKTRKFLVKVLTVVFMVAMVMNSLVRINANNQVGELTPTNTDNGLINATYDTNHALYTNPAVAGGHGLYLIANTKDGQEVVSTAYGHTILDVSKLDLNTMKLRFVFKNGDVETRAAFDVLLPNFDTSGRSNLVFDADRLADKEQGLVVNSALNNDYSQGMYYYNNEPNVAGAGTHRLASDYQNAIGSLKD